MRRDEDFEVLDYFKNLFSNFDALKFLNRIVRKNLILD